MEVREKCKNHPKFHIPCSFCEELQEQRDEEKRLLKSIDDLRYLDELASIKIRNKKLMDVLTGMQLKAAGHIRMDDYGRIIKDY